MTIDFKKIQIDEELEDLLDAESMKYVNELKELWGV